MALAVALWGAFGHPAGPTVSWPHPAATPVMLLLQVSAPEATADAVTATRQTYIQESINFTGAELAARLPSMQAALRAQRGAADAAAAGAAAAAAASTSGRNGTGARPGAARPAARPPAVPPVPPVTRPGPHPAAAAISAAAAAGPVPSPAAPFSSRPYAGASVAAAATASTSAPTMQVAEVGTSYNGNGTPEQEDTASSSTSSSVQMPVSPAMPSPDNLAGLSASEKLQALQQVQQVSRQVLTKQPFNNPYYANAPKTIDIRMYDQLVVAHNKLSQKLSDANAHVGVLEAQINQCNEDLIAAFELMKQVGGRVVVCGAGAGRQRRGVVLVGCRLVSCTAADAPAR